MKNYVLYLRKSRADMDAEAHGAGETLARHEQTLLELAKRLKLNVTDIYREIVSGETIAARPVMQKLLTEVEAGIWAGVVVMEVERLARGDTVDQGIMAQAFKFSDTKIITPVKTYDPNDEHDEEYFEFSLFMSRREYKAINRRLQRGRLASFNEGKYIGSTAPYGYARKKLDNAKGLILESDPDEADVVRLVYDLYTKGEQQADGTYKRLGAYLICQRLNALKIKPRKSETWSTASVRHILTNPVYIGKLRWKRRAGVKRIIAGEITVGRPRTPLADCIVVDGLHEPIITEAAWDLARHFTQQNPPNPVPPHRSIKNPLSGIVYCGKCGRRMMRSQHLKTGRADTLKCRVPSCDNVSSYLSVVESRIVDALGKWLADYKIIVGNTSGITSDVISQVDMKERALKKLDDEISDIAMQKDNLHNLLEQGIYTAAVFAERSRILADRHQQTENDKKLLMQSIKQEVSNSKTTRMIMPRVEEIISIYHKVECPKARNDLLKEVLGRVVYTKTARARPNEAPSGFTVELYPILPK